MCGRYGGWGAIGDPKGVVLLLGVSGPPSSVQPICDDL